jgi:5'-3' exonuclease
MSKLNISMPVLLVDTSYWMYYRYFALRNWYNRAYPENIIKNPNFNSEHNWLEDEIFMCKYKKLFIDNIKKLCKVFKTVISNTVFCIDCPHKEIWRCELTSEYKGTRLESHKKNQFNSFNVFIYIKKYFLIDLKDKYNIKIIDCSRCEADDIIGYCAPYLINNTNINLNNNCNKVYILGNDNDYLQICSDKIMLVNGIGKILSKCDNNISSNSSSSSNNDKYIGEKYLISKILLGDVSDNIKGCMIDYEFLNNTKNKCSGEYTKINKLISSKIVNNNEKYKILQTILEEIRKKHIDSNNSINNNINNSLYDKLFIDDKFKKNAILMDFKLIPNELKNNLETFILQII